MMPTFVIIASYHCFKRTYLKLKTFELSLICLSPSSLQDVSGRASELLIGKKPETWPLSKSTRIFAESFRVTIEGHISVCNFFGFPLLRSTIGWKSSVALQTIGRFSRTYYDCLRAFSRAWRRQRRGGSRGGFARGGCNPPLTSTWFLLFCLILPKIIINIVFFFNKVVSLPPFDCLSSYEKIINMK